MNRRRVTFEPNAQVTYADVQGGLSESESAGTAGDRPSNDDEATAQATVEEPVNFKLNVRRKHRYGRPRRDQSMEGGLLRWWYGNKHQWNWASRHYSGAQS